jgi:hypothetical protein
MYAFDFRQNKKQHMKEKLEKIRSNGSQSSHSPFYCRQQIEEAVSVEHVLFLRNTRSNYLGHTDI